MPESRRLHFGYLDGLRGLLAAYVVLFHVVADGREALVPGSPINILRFGHEAVVVFMVLSGFLLALPVARSADRQPIGGTSGFLVRRARRILPPYYPALFLLPAFLIAVEVANGFTRQGTDWGRIRELSLGPGMLSHLVMLQNLTPAWSVSVNPILWSVATEWWTYFLFILVLVPLWRRRGVLVAVATGMAASLLPALMVWAGAPTPAGFPHLVGAFVLGMAGASILAGRSPGDDRRWPTGLTLAGWLSLLVFAYVTLYRSDIRLDDTRRWFSDTLVATSATVAIIALAAPAGMRNKPKSASEAAAWALQVPPIRFLGRISYSLYLTHLVVWAILGITLNLAPIKAVMPFSLDPMAARVFVLIPAQLGIAYISYRLFERPFLRAAVTGPSASPRGVRLALASWLSVGGFIRRSFESHGGHAAQGWRHVNRGFDRLGPRLPSIWRTTCRAS
jgi:peptidoglycan/LPS O-acetylase OafA/YrhL